MTSQQKQAHFRMLESLPVRTHLRQDVEVNIWSGRPRRSKTGNSNPAHTMKLGQK